MAESELESVLTRLFSSSRFRGIVGEKEGGREAGMDREIERN